MSCCLDVNKKLLPTCGLRDCSHSLDQLSRTARGYLRYKCEKALARAISMQGRWPRGLR
jgi:hypothetical protein